jgi:hypothetical protein
MGSLGRRNATIRLNGSRDLGREVTAREWLATHDRTDQRIAVPTTAQVLILCETPSDEFTLAFRQFTIEHGR